MRSSPSEPVPLSKPPRIVSTGHSAVPLRLLVCALCALGGFLLGRQAAPRRTADIPISREAHRLAPPSSTSPVQSAGRSARGTDDVAADGTVAARRRNLVSLLQQVQRSRHEPNLGALFSLVSWTQSADPEELAECLALGDEMRDTKERHGTLDMLQTLVFVRWAALDGPAALEAWLSLPEDRRSGEAGDQLFLNWSEQGDPQDALDHAFAALSEDQAASTAAHIFSRWQLRDPAGAAACALRLAASADPAERNAGTRCADTLLDRLHADQGLPAALDWIERWPGAKRDELRLRLLGELDAEASDSPAQAAHILAKLEGSSPIIEGRMNALVQNFATRAPDEAKRWASALPEPARTEALAVVARTVVDGMLGKGRGAEAPAWLDRQSGSPDARAAGYEQLADAAAQGGDIVAAVRLASQATGAAAPTTPLRQSQLLQQWLENNPDRAVKVIGLLTGSSNATGAAPIFVP